MKPDELDLRVRAVGVVREREHDPPDTTRYARTTAPTTTHARGRARSARSRRLERIEPHGASRSPTHQGTRGGQSDDHGRGAWPEANLPEGAGEN